MLHLIFPPFTFRNCSFSVFAGANVPGEDRFCFFNTLEDKGFSLITLGKCIPGWQFFCFGPLFADQVHLSDCFEIRVTPLPVFRGTWPIYDHDLLCHLLSNLSGPLKRVFFTSRLGSESHAWGLKLSVDLEQSSLLGNWSYWQVIIFSAFNLCESASWDFYYPWEGFSCIKQRCSVTIQSYKLTE